MGKQRAGEGARHGARQGHGPRHGHGHGARRGYDEENRPELPSALRVMEAVRKSTGAGRAVTRVGKAEERLARAKRLADEGRLEAPRARVPVHILKGMRAKRKAREARAESAGRQMQVALLREQGGESGVRREDARAMVARSFAGDRSGLLSGRRGLAPSVGKFRAGALHLSAGDAARLNRTPRRR